MKYLQQGDVLIKPTKIPDNLKKIKTNVLQEGEHTGHAHRLFGDGFTVFQDKEKVKYLRIVEPIMLKHEEHREIQLPAGDYVIGIVREYDHMAEEARNVQD